MNAIDWPAVAAIYREGIATGEATFEVAPPPTGEEWQRCKIPRCSVVARMPGEIVGWAALSPVSARPVYAGVAEVSLYVAERLRGRGVGSALLAELIQRSERHGLWTLQAGIFPENHASLRLHVKLGFRIVGTRERLGRMAEGPQRGRWRDVVLLERRSQVVGVISCRPTET